MFTHIVFLYLFATTTTNAIPYSNSDIQMRDTCNNIYQRLDYVNDQLTQFINQQSTYDHDYDHDDDTPENNPEDITKRLQSYFDTYQLKCKDLQQQITQNAHTLIHAQSAFDRSKNRTDYELTLIWRIINAVNQIKQHDKHHQQHHELDDVLHILQGLKSRLFGHINHLNGHVKLKIASINTAISQQQIVLQNCIYNSRNNHLFMQQLTPHITSLNKRIQLTQLYNHKMTTQLKHDIQHLQRIQREVQHITNMSCNDNDVRQKLLVCQKIVAANITNVEQQNQLLQQNDDDDDQNDTSDNST